MKEKKPPSTHKHPIPSPYTIFWAWREGYTLQALAARYDYPLETIQGLARLGRKRYLRKMEASIANNRLKTAAVNLYKFTDRSPAEIADFMGIPEKRIRGYCGLDE